MIAIDIATGIVLGFIGIILFSLIISLFCSMVSD